MTIEPEQGAGQSPAEGGKARPTQISHDHPDPGDPVAFAEQVDNRCRREMMKELAHQDEIDTAIAQWKRGGVADEGGQPPLLSQSGRRGVPLHPEGPQAEPALGGPGNGHPREIAGSGSDIEQRERGPRIGHGGSQRAMQPDTHHIAATKPPIGAGDVAQRFTHGGGLGGGIIEELDPGCRFEGVHGNPEAMYPPR